MQPEPEPETALVFVHGWSANSGVWAAQTDFFGTRHKVYLVDLPGHEGPPPVRGAARLRLKFREKPGPTRSVEECGVELARALEAEKLKSARLVGWSLGAQVICHAAAAGGYRPASLTLVGATPCFTAPDGGDWGQPPARTRLFVWMMRDDFKSGLATFVKSLLDHEINLNSEELSVIGRMFLDFPPDEETALALLDDFVRADIRPVLASLGVPVYAVHGALDRISPPGAVELWRAAPGFKRAVVMPECGHAPFMTAPGEFNDALGGILGEQ
ncbi:MAG: alpha/beta fold hydrolase [Nitrospinae bacterium]|nr:alpha/beta fold hydrolase [Nitrospinota bacterium]